MADIKTLQKAIDDKRIDTRQLNEVQLKALDEAFKSGDLKGYDSAQDYERLIDLGAQSVAGVKEKRLKGFESATGFDRGDFVLIGGAGGAFLPYYKNKAQIMDAFSKYGFRDVYGVDTRYNSMGQIYQNRFTVLKDAMKKLPNVRGPAGIPIRMFSNLAGMVDNTIDFFSKTRKFGATPALSTEAQSIALGSIGAGAGAGLFEIANLGTDFVAATSQDMANLTDNDIRKLPFGERLLFNSLSEAYNDLLWAGGAMSLIPLVRYAGKEGIKNSLGLNSEHSKALAESFERVGMKPTVAALIPGENAFQNFFKKFFTTIGVYPLVSGPLAKFNRDFNKRLTNEEFLAISEHLNLAPGSNISLMNYAGINEMRKEWKKVLDAINVEYGEVRKYYDEIGNPAFIPTKTIRQETDRLLTQLKSEYPDQLGLFNSLERGARDLTEVDDPMVQYIKYLNDVSRNYQGENIRISDWVGLSRAQTSAYTNTKFGNVRNQLLVIRNAMEKDLNSLNEATSRANLKEVIFKDEYKQILETQGPEAAEAFIDKQVRTANLAFNRLKEANAFYSLVLRPFQKSKVASQLRSVDSKLFADKGIEMTGQSSIYPDEVFDKVIRRILSADSPDAVKQLKQILGVTRSSYDIVDEAGKITRTVKIPQSKEAKEMYDRYVKMWLWDSWNNATANPLRDFRSISTQVAAERAAAKGFKVKRPFQLDDVTEQRVRAKTKTNETLDVTEIDARVFTESDIANLNEGIIRTHDFGELDIEKYVKNIGLDNKQGRDKIREIFGGGAEGAKALERIDDLVKMKRAVDSVTYRDPSTFVQRAITLRAGQGGGLAAGATAAAFGFGNTIKLILGSRLFGSLITSPATAEHLMEMNKYMRFMTDQKGVYSLSPQLTPRAERTFARFINSLMEAEGDDFRVDPNNIDFEEIRQKIISLDPNLPLQSTFDFGTMPKFTRDRIQPEYDTAKNLKPEVAQAGEEYLQGINLIEKSDEQFDAVDRRESMVTAEETAPVPPTIPMATQTAPQATGQQRAQQFAALFPQDTLGQAVAARQLKEGGLVEDAYAQAEEILNG
jgi:hypothetical protein|tara:strand:+ start:3754 stop:6951 length:3198 start_codon:yes stop_codon:yes gene_type:complete